MHKGIIILVIISVVLASLLAIQVIQDGNLAVTRLNTEPVAVQNIQPLPVTNIGENSFNTTGGAFNGTGLMMLNAESTIFNQVFKKVQNSVVQITSTINVVGPIINGNPLQGESTSLGSGFIQDAAKGLIITNNHVIQGSNTVDVTFASGNTYSAKVIGTDPLSDLGVLQIVDDFSAEHIASLHLANSSQLEIGQQVIAIGNPFALSNSMTNGIISQVGRLLPNQEMGFSIPDVIQTDAAINPGNSGGPLLDVEGNVIGVNSAITSQTGEFAGIGFAIPSNTVARIVPYLIKDGKYDHPWLGIAGVNLTPNLAQQLGLPRDSKGVVIASVTPGSPAADAGIVGRVQNGNIPAGDIITAIDEHQVKRMEDIISYVEEQRSVGDSVVITVNRGGQSQDLTVTLQPTPLSTSQ
ncbi:MAG: trypsin-like peptidase domain-containing protein [Thermoproteota archaeon]|nr:trypsin-like peptidase domain-containing protein [Thermoproteota archaeon]